MASKIIGGAAVVGAICMASGVLPARAGVVAFTWDPSGFAGGSAAFSADAIAVTNYIRTTNVNNLTTLKQTFSGSQIQTTNGFSLGGLPVTAPGLNSSYGLYFRIDPAGAFPINRAER